VAVTVDVPQQRLEPFAPFRIRIDQYEFHACLLWFWFYAVGSLRPNPSATIGAPPIQY
jgi:hypothetical protein